jgi:hypothetical protein
MEEKGKIKKSIEDYFENQIFTSVPKSEFIGSAKNLKDLLTGKAITAEDLYNESEKDLLISMYIHLVQLNGKVRWHDKIIWTGFIGGLLTVCTAIIVGIINFCFA